jgi:hypothetical protein
MYYLAKTAQAAGIIVVFSGFILRFPELMNPRLLGSGVVFFLAGWLIERFLLRGR